MEILKQLLGTKLLAKAVDKWISKGGVGAWSYTHAWKKVNRSYWGKVSCLASVDSVEWVKLAQELGYVPALVVSQFSSNKAFKLEGSDIKWVPCPAQTKDNVSCSSCKLCFNDSRLRDLNLRNSICGTWSTKKYD